MIRPLLLAALLALAALPAQAQCFADYKAKQDGPLRLHYGVAQVSACDRKAAKDEPQRQGVRGFGDDIPAFLRRPVIVRA